jgi:hypothetical protein
MSQGAVEARRFARRPPTKNEEGQVGEGTNNGEKTLEKALRYC